MAERRRIVSVLRSGGDFKPEHVQALQRQVTKHAPTGTEFLCLSDVPIAGVQTVPLQHDWPNWWCKMELFRPDIRGDFFCTDLDNVFLGPLDDVLSVNRYTNQRGQSNALAYYPEDMRAEVWDEWMRGTAGHMHRFDPRYSVNPHSFGDGGFIASVAHADQHWEDLLPGQVVNIAELRMHAPWPFRPFDIPKSTRVLLCHRPFRPWLVPALRRFRLYD